MTVVTPPDPRIEAAESFALGGSYTTNWTLTLSPPADAQWAVLLVGNDGPSPSGVTYNGTSYARTVYSQTGSAGSDRSAAVMVFPLTSGVTSAVVNGTSAASLYYAIACVCYFAQDTLTVEQTGSNQAKYNAFPAYTITATGPSQLVLTAADNRSSGTTATPYSNMTIFQGGSGGKITDGCSLFSDLPTAGGTVNIGCTFGSNSSATCSMASVLLSVGSPPATATLTATSDLTVNGTASRIAAAVLAATTALTGAATIDTPATSTLVATSTLTAGGTTGTIYHGSSTLAATSDLTASGDVTTPTTASATLAATSGLTAGATQAHAASAILAATSGLASSGHIPGTTISASAALAATSGLVAAVDARVTAWDLDESGTDLALLFDDEPVTLDVTPPAAIPPATITPAVELRRISYPNMPATAVDSDEWKVESDHGSVHLIVDGRDVTYLRGIPVEISGWSDELPFGEQVLTFSAPQIQPEDQPGTGDLSMFRQDAPVELALIKVDGTRVHLFSGRLILDGPGHDEQATRADWQAKGALIADADHQQHRAPIIQDPEDIGRIIPRELNHLVSRGFATVKNVSTGILSSDRGSYGDKVTQYVSDQLGTAWTDDGRNWTVAPVPGRKRTYALALNQDPDAPVWTFTLNQPGLTVSAPKDETQRLNVIYGHGVEPDGTAWGNWEFPDISPDTAPPYPNVSADHTITLGTTDADTDSGTGVSTWQQGARNLGFDITVDGVYNATDEAIVERVQAKCGIQVDGVIGPQTWVATFQTGSNAGDLNNAYRKPLAIDPRVEPWTYAANGAIVGRNPAYDPTVARYETDVDFGTGITKAAGIKAAQQMLARSKDAGRTATITTTSSPWEGHWLEVLPSHKVRVKGLRGDTFTTWVVSRSVDLANGKVTFECDTKARDAMTLAAIQSRNIAAGLTPSGRPLPIMKASAQSLDTMTQFDRESRAGVVPRLPLFQNLWSVINVPVSLTGIIAITDLITDTPISEFILAYFGLPITANQLLHEIGNPFTEAGDKNWTAKHDHLVDRYQLIEVFGSPDQPCGYSPGNKGDGDPETGQFRDTNPLNFTLRRGGRVWAAFFSPTSTFVGGHIWPGQVPT